ncbi:MAG: LIC_13387 family protein [bacterium]
MFKRGNRLFAAATISLFLVAAAHTLGHFAGVPEDAALAAVANSMRGYSFDLGMGMHPSFMDIHESLSLTMSLFLIFLGIQNLATLALAPEAKQLLRTLALINFLCAGALVVLYAAYRVPPPLISFAVVSVLFLWAWFSSQRREKVG